MEIREDEARVVRRIYNLYVYERLSIQQIARLLNSEGIRTRRDKLFHASGIRGILGFKGEHPTGAKLPAIVDPKLWEQAQKRRRDNPHP